MGGLTIMSEMLTNVNGQQNVTETDGRAKAVEEAMRIFDNMTEADKKEITDFAAKIDISDSQLVRNFGAKSEKQNAAFCDTFLTYATSNGGREEREVKDTIIKLVDEVEKASPTDEGFFGKLFFSVDQKKKRIVRKVQSVSQVIEDIEKELLALQKGVEDNITNIDTFGKSIIQNMNILEKYIIAGEIAYKKFFEEEGHACEEKMKAVGEHEKIIIKREFDEKCKDFLTKLNDLRTAQSLAMVSVMQLFEMKKENALIYDSIHKSTQFTIPIWKQQCAIAIMQKKAENAAKANKSLTAATEKMLQDNVAAINAGYVDAVKTSQEGFINPDVIIKLTDDIKQTLVEVQKLEEEGFNKQVERSKVLANGRKSLMELAVSIDRDANLSELIKLSASHPDNVQQQIAGSESSSSTPVIGSSSVSATKLEI